MKMNLSSVNIKNFIVLKKITWGIFCTTFLLVGGTSLKAADRVWSGGLNTSFRSASNYTPSGGSLSSDNLYFQTATSSDLTTGTDSFNFHSLFIESGGSGFTLSGAGQLVVKGQINVSDNTSATINNQIDAYHYTDGTPLEFFVGNGSSLILGGAISASLRPFVKKGAGTLTLLYGSGTVQYIAGVHRYEEGTVILGNDAVIKRSDSVNKTLPVYLGTSTTTAKLSGGGAVNGILHTAGATRSIIETGGDGSLFIASINAAQGATFNMALGDVISGDGTFNGSNLVFNFTGGIEDTVYTLFDYTGGGGYTIDTSTFSVATAGYVLDSSYGNAGWFLDGSSLNVRFSAVPEPGAGLLFAATGLVLAIRRSRNQRFK